MKNKLLSLMIGFVLLLLAGCSEVDVTTVVNKDGSCIRTVVLDSSDVDDTPYPVNFDGADSLVITKAEKKIVYTAYYGSVNNIKLNQQVEGDTVYHLAIQPRLTKKFRWFYTWYRYSESYGRVFHFQHVPIQDYLTQDEIDLVISENDSSDEDKKIDAKLEAWYQQNFFIEFYTRLENMVRSGKLDISIESLEASKEPLRQLFLQDVLELDSDNNTFTDNDFDIFRQTLHFQNTDRAKKVLNDVIAPISKEMEWLASIQLSDMTNHVEMPGLVMDTNAETIEGNKVSWDINSNRLLFEDYEMWVESRTVNRWPFLGTLIFTGALLVIMLVAIVRKKRLAE